MSDPRLRLRAATPASNLEEVLNALAAPHIVVVIASGADPAHQLAHATLLGLLRRVFPNTASPVGRGELGPNPWAAPDLAAATAAQPIAPARCVAAPNRIRIAIGPASGHEADLFIDGDDWTAYLSTTAPAPTMSPPSHGGLGLHAAVALGANEIFKGALAELGLPTNRLEGTLFWNLIDYRLGRATDYTTDPNRTPRADPLLFAGAGSLGSSAIAALAATTVEGTGVVIDDDIFDPDHNQYRYPAATTTTRGPKAAWAAGIGRRSGLDLAAHDNRIATWASEQMNPGFDGIAIVTVDRTDGRLDAANLMPRATIAGGVTGLSLQIHRSYAADATTACSYCLYVDASDRATQLDLYHDLTGLDDCRIVELLDGDRLTQDDLGLSGRLDLVGQRVEDLARVAYAEATIDLTAGEDAAEITAPQVSWLAGVILAAEIAKDALDLPPLDRRLRVDLRGLPLGVTDRPQPDPTGRCICHNPVRHKMATSWY